MAAAQYFYLLTDILGGGGLLTAVLSILALMLSGDLGGEQWFNLILLFRWRDLSRWLQRRRDSLVTRLERMLMLYTPACRGVLVFHVLFNAILLTTYSFLVILNTESIDLATWAVAIPILLIALGIRRFAMRLST